MAFAAHLLGVCVCLQDTFKVAKSGRDPPSPKPHRLTTYSVIGTGLKGVRVIGTGLKGVRVIGTGLKGVQARASRIGLQLIPR